MRRAFTLIELLTVIGLLAALAALLFPLFAAVREKGRATACLSNVRQLGIAQLLYAAEYDDHLPHWWAWGPRGGFIFWPELFRPYLRADRVYACASAVAEPDAIGDRLADYALLTWGPGGTGARAAPYWRWPGNMRAGDVSRPAETFNLIDGMTTTVQTRAFLARHGAGMNVGYLDGHAGYLLVAEAWRVARDGSGGWYYVHIAADRE